MIPLLLTLLLACQPKPEGPPQGWADISTPAPATAAPEAPAPAPPDAPAAPPAAEPPPAPPAGAPEGAACLRGDECASGVCEGEGCRDETPGRCTALTRPCTRDLVTWCGCDLKTFQASGSCPMRRYLHRGPCGEEAP